MPDTPMIFSSALATIGDTPMVKVTNMDTGPCELFLKMENQNPGGSIKDRIALSMIEVAEKEGKLKPGGLIVEGTAGNTGIALALVARQKGYPLILVVPDKMAAEKVNHMRALGAKVHITRSDVQKGHPDYYQDMAERIAKEVGGFYINQFANPANPLAHFETTGPEIWEQMHHDLDAVFVGVGSGGTMTGLAQYFAQVDPSVDIILADPEGSILADYIDTGKVPNEVGSWYVEGIGEDFLPPVANFEGIRTAYSITDKEAFSVLRDLLNEEGILAGSSTGTLLASALHYCRKQKTPKRVVTFVCDTGNKYLSKAFSDSWMLDQGLMERPRTNTLRDMILNLYEEGSVTVAKPNDTLQAAFKRMRANAVSQLPVLDDEGRPIGFISQQEVFSALHQSADNFSLAVSEVMLTPPPVLEADADIQDLRLALKDAQAIMITENEKFIGLITRDDWVQNLLKASAQD